MRTVLVKEEGVETMNGNYRIQYELLMSHFEKDEGSGNFFGIRIRQFDYDKKSLIDGSTALGITEDFDEAKCLFAAFVKEIVMPVHLYDLIDDWQSAFHPRKGG